MPYSGLSSRKPTGQTATLAALAKRSPGESCSTTADCPLTLKEYGNAKCGVRIAIMRHLSNVEIVGAQYGRWTIIRSEPNGPRFRRCVLARCQCGTERVVTLEHLTSGRSQSCGCLRVEQMRANQQGWQSCKRHGHTDGRRRSRTYTSWEAMRQRCNNPNAPIYQYYGGRGLVVCPRWELFDAFLADMGERPAGTSLDRIDNEGRSE